jgi:hypothetical protein
MPNVVVQTMIKCFTPKKYKRNYSPVNNGNLLLRFFSSDMLWMSCALSVMIRYVIVNAGSER